MTERLLNEETSEKVKEAFQNLKEPVKVLFFSTKTNCEYCDDMRTLVEEVVDLSEKLTMSEYDLEEDVAVAQQYNVHESPALVIAGQDSDQIIDYGVRYLGIPSGHEFSSLIYDLVLVSERDSGLDMKTRHALGELKQPVHLQVFVTPT
jgi:alkyl hydroperoxide reductase subunit AhpF